MCPVSPSGWRLRVPIGPKQKGTNAPSSQVQSIQTAPKSALYFLEQLFFGVLKLELVVFYVFLCIVVPVPVIFFI